MDCLYVAADPGKNGAFVCIDQTGNVVDRMVMPRITKDGPVDLVRIFDWLLNILKTKDWDKVDLCIEDVHALYGVSASSTSSLMENKGQIHGIFSCVASMYIKTSVHFIPPKTWQKTVWMQHDKIMKAGKVDTKATSLSCASRIWPTDKFLATEKCKKAHDGIVDAMLIAEYARRVLK